MWVSMNWAAELNDNLSFLTDNLNENEDDSEILDLPFDRGLYVQTAFFDVSFQRRQLLLF